MTREDLLAQVEEIRFQLRHLGDRVADELASPLSDETHEWLTRADTDLGLAAGVLGRLAVVLR